MKHFYTLSVICFLRVGILCARETIPGLPSAAPAAIPVSISNVVSVINNLADGVFITAGQSGAQDFALAGYSSVSHKFIPYAPKEVTLNGKSGSNPLYDATIDFISFSASQPASFFVVPNKNTSAIFFREATGTLLSLDTLPNAIGAPAAGVVAMTGSSIGHTYVAVKPALAFGELGSGIVDVVGLSGEISVPSIAAPFNNTSVFLTLNTSPVSIGGDALLGWSVPLQSLYVGVQNMITGANISDRAALVARALPINNIPARLAFSVIVPSYFDFASLDSNENYVVLATGSSVTGALTHVQMMETSTRQPVLVVCGRFLANGETADDVKNELYALPLNVRFRGTVSQQVDLFESGYLSEKGATSLGQVAQNASELYTIADDVVRVGKGPLLDSGTVISQVIIQSDTVYAVVNEPLPGVYASQALFDVHGLVRGWTPWQRAIDVPEPLTAAALNTLNGTWFLGTTADNIANTVQRTTWQTGDQLHGVAAGINRLTVPQPQSITALSGYDYRTPGMGAVAAFVCTERNQVILAQAGVLANGSSTLYTLLPDLLYEQKIFADDTILAQPITTEPLVVIRGGLLADMTPLTTTTIVHSDTVADTWLCVGGNGGVAVWATDVGSGWGVDLNTTFDAIPVGIHMQTLGNFKDVRLLYADSPFLYVLMPHMIARIDCTNGILNAPSVVIAQVGATLPASSPDDVITDTIFSQELGLLATNIGLYRIKDGSSAQGEEPVWELVALPESELPVKKITGFGSNGLPQSLVEGGYSILLSGTARNNRSTVNRLAIEPFDTITATTVLPFECDAFINQKPSFFIDFGEYQDSVVTDGGQYIFARSVQGESPANLLTPNILEFITQPRSANRFIGRRSRELKTPLPSNADITTLVQNPATGAWYIATNTGLIVQG